MALLFVVLLGAMVGWFASILERDEAPSAIRLQLLVGALASTIGAFVLSGSALFGAISLAMLGMATATAIATLTLYWYVFVRRT
jgi:uncharacterized membrane protein YeaQ/YmgE (transglycosylase-associated protein family)